MKRSTPLHLASIWITLFGSLALLALPAAAQDCSNVTYRLWTQDSETWYRLGETVEIETGKEGHIYLHVDSRSQNPYSTSAEIGYPETFGVGGPPSTKVVRRLRMQEQSGEDRSVGRIRFDAMAPGTTRLGYRLIGVRSPGSLDLVTVGCRVGAIPVEVVAGGHGNDEAEEALSEADRAAQELVSRLYRGLLRRPEAGQLDDGFVAGVRSQGRSGVLWVAEIMLASDEFRRDALRLTEQTHGRSSLDQLRRQLLGDIYRDLYGYAEPDAQGREDDLRDLEGCLSSTGGDDACKRLGREIVNRRQFYEHHQQLIDALSTPARWRGRG